jgi:hypothetical protein
LILLGALVTPSVCRALVYGLTVVPAIALECTEFNAINELERRTVVFVGDLVVVPETYPEILGAAGVGTFRVVERLKGKVPDQAFVLDSAKDGYEGWPVLTTPGRYLVFADPLLPEVAERIGAEFEIPMSCPKTRLLRELSMKDVLLLRRYVYANRERLAPGKPE